MKIGPFWYFMAILFRLVGTILGFPPQSWFCLLPLIMELAKRGHPVFDRQISGFAFSCSFRCKPGLRGSANPALRWTIGTPL